MNGISVADPFANVNENNENLSNFCFLSTSMKTNVHVIENCHGWLEREPAIMFMGIELANHIRPQQIRRESKPAKTEPSISSKGLMCKSTTQTLDPREDLDSHSAIHKR